MEEVLDSNLAKEILTVLPYLDEEIINNLSSEELAKITDLAADATKDFYIQKDKKLKDQNISLECKNFLSLLYYQFVSPTEKEKLLDNWIKNDLEQKIEE